jgi:hypothetical protein
MCTCNWRVELVAAGLLLESLAYHVHFERQHRLVKGGKFVHLLDARALRHQNNPRPASVVHEAQLAKAKPEHGVAHGLQARIKFETCLLAGQHGRFLVHAQASDSPSGRQANRFHRRT